MPTTQSNPRGRVRHSVTALIALLLLAPSVFANNVEVSVKEPAYDCGQGCVEAALLVQYPTYDPENYYYFCDSREFLTSMLYCSQTYCTPSEVEANWAYESDICETYGSGAMPPIADVESWLDTGNVSEVNTVEMAGTMYNSTILPDRASFEAGFKTLQIWSEEMVMHQAFGWAMYILVGMMVLVGILNRGVTPLSHTSYFASSPDLNPSVFSRVRTTYRKHLGAPALFGYTHMNGWLWATVPTRIHSLFIFIYVALNLIFCSVGYNGKIFAENLYWPGKDDVQLGRYIADRTGIICFYNLPLMFLFAGRNDIFIWLTGWTYTSMNLFHRWVAKVATLQAFVHSVVWVYLERKTLGIDWRDMYWRTGVFATVTMCAVLPFSIQPLRRRLYEAFLAIHAVLAIVTVVLLFYHVSIMDGEYDIFLWFCVGVWVCIKLRKYQYGPWLTPRWAFERLARLVRMAVLSYSAILTLRPNTIASLTSHKRGLIRLNITVPFTFTPRPGQHYYIYTPKQWTFWENHPFSLASWRPSPTSGEAGIEVKGRGTELSFLLAPQKGTTRRILRQLESTSNGEKEMRLMLEGPYGSTHNFTSFNHLLLVAGGSGITALLPYIYEAQTMPEKYAARRVSVIWAVKDLEYAADVLAQELRPVLGESRFVIRIHRTLEDEEAATQSDIHHVVRDDRPVVLDVSATTSQDDVSAESRDAKTLPGSGREYQIIIGRPVMADVLRSELGHLEGMHSMAVLSCGPAGMLDDMRQAVTRSYGDEPGQVQAGRLEYVEDHFSW